MTEVRSVKPLCTQQLPKTMFSAAGGTSKSLSALELVALKFLMRMFLPAGRQARKEASLDFIHLLFIVFSCIHGLASSALVLYHQG
jgi:hypothetical protein